MSVGIYITDCHSVHSTRMQHTTNYNSSKRIGISLNPSSEKDIAELVIIHHYISS